MLGRRVSRGGKIKATTTILALDSRINGDAKDHLKSTQTDKRVKIPDSPFWVSIDVVTGEAVIRVQEDLMFYQDLPTTYIYMLHDKLKLHPIFKEILTRDSKADLKNQGKEEGYYLNRNSIYFCYQPLINLRDGKYNAANTARKARRTSVSGDGDGLGMSNPKVGENSAAGLHLLDSVVPQDLTNPSAPTETTPPATETLQTQGQASLTPDQHVVETKKFVNGRFVSMVVRGEVTEEKALEIFNQNANDGVVNILQFFDGTKRAVITHSPTEFIYLYTKYKDKESTLGLLNSEGEVETNVINGTDVEFAAIVAIPSDVMEEFTRRARRNIPYLERLKDENLDTSKKDLQFQKSGFEPSFTIRVLLDEICNGRKNIGLQNPDNDQNLSDILSSELSKEVIGLARGGQITTGQKKVGAASESIQEHTTPIVAMAENWNNNNAALQTAGGLLGKFKRALASAALGLVEVDYSDSEGDDEQKSIKNHNPCLSVVVIHPAEYFKNPPPLKKSTSLDNISEAAKDDATANPAKTMRRSASAPSLGTTKKPEPTAPALNPNPTSDLKEGLGGGEEGQGLAAVQAVEGRAYAFHRQSAFGVIKGRCTKDQALQILANARTRAAGRMEKEEHPLVALQFIEEEQRKIAVANNEGSSTFLYFKKEGTSSLTKLDGDEVFDMGDNEEFAAVFNIPNEVIDKINGVHSVNENNSESVEESLKRGFDEFYQENPDANKSWQKSFQERINAINSFYKNVLKESDVVVNDEKTFQNSTEADAVGEPNVYFAQIQTQEELRSLDSKGDSAPSSSPQTKTATSLQHIQGIRFDLISGNKSNVWKAAVGEGNNLYSFSNSTINDGEAIKDFDNNNFSFVTKKSFQKLDDALAEVNLAIESSIHQLMGKDRLFERVLKGITFEGIDVTSNLGKLQTALNGSKDNEANKKAILTYIINEAGVTDGGFKKSDDVRGGEDWKIALKTLSKEWQDCNKNMGLLTQYGKDKAVGMRTKRIVADGLEAYNSSKCESYKKYITEVGKGPQEASQAA